MSAGYDTRNTDGQREISLPACSLLLRERVGVRERASATVNRIGTACSPSLRRRAPHPGPLPKREGEKHYARSASTVSDKGTGKYFTYSFGTTCQNCPLIRAHSCSIRAA